MLRPAGKLAPGIEVREALRTLDPEPALSVELVKLGLWISDYYFAPPGEVFRAMLPLRRETRDARQVHLTEKGRHKILELADSLLEESKGGQDATLLAYLDRRPGASLEILRKKFPQALPRALGEEWAAVEEVKKERSRRKVLAVRLAGPLPEPPPRLSPVARRIIEALERQGPAEDHRQLLEAANAHLASLHTLSRAGLIVLGEGKRGSWPGKRSEGAESGHPNGGFEAPLTLTPAQNAVLDDLYTRLDSGKFGVVLLHGITGSGKTEIYLHLIARCLEQDRSALMLVPEISLTPAMQSLFFSRFGDQVALLHSGLTERERDDAWWRVRRGETRVVLGTRSAVFAPLANLGAVIVDEEHDSSYKQDETPRYHGRDVAVVRARMAGRLGASRLGHALAGILLERAGGQISPGQVDGTRGRQEAGDGRDRGHAAGVPRDTHASARLAPAEARKSKPSFAPRRRPCCCSTGEATRGSCYAGAAARRSAA